MVDHLLEYGKRNSQGHFRHDKWFTKLPSIILEIRIICCNYSQKFESFLWDFGAGKISPQMQHYREKRRDSKHEFGIKSTNNY